MVIDRLKAVFMVSLMTISSSAMAALWPSAKNDSPTLAKAIAKIVDHETEKRFVFDPALNKWFAYDEEGDLIASGPAAGGADYCPDVGKKCRTVVGEFKAISRKGANCKSSIFPVGKGGAPMPYCTFFQGGYAVHGSYQPLTSNVSHGCVRVDPDDAKWLYENFLYLGTRIIILPYPTANQIDEDETKNENASEAESVPAPAS